ncbi:dihydropteroate synthase [Pseudoclavibacter endophyticus]|uniref:Dihydropteroate synthase n=2 Tax=Pseudoclavibacter endophyticus TaxID=1778590 RepID=A0A6H9WQQ5_9MICO|nr:dihydropteroate synthase [Pseudoclavibacter endophyticus]
MAIVNRTPDSFYDGGTTFALDDAVGAALAAERAGADLVDIGGQPFAAGDELSVADEIERVVPVIEAIRRRSQLPVSAETYRPEVAAACLDAGADVINDTSGLRDRRLADIAADRGASLIITHSLATPRTAFPHPTYADVAGEVRDFLADRAAAALEHGLTREQIVVDPGHDLNKTTLHTLELSRRLGMITALGYSTLAAVSNKDFIGESLGRPKPERLAGSVAAAVASIMLGARIVRMHNVREAVDATRMTEAILGYREPHHALHNV